MRVYISYGGVNKKQFNREEAAKELASLPDITITNRIHDAEVIVIPDQGVRGAMKKPYKTMTEIKAWKKPEVRETIGQPSLPDFKSLGETMKEARKPKEGEGEIVEEEENERFVPVVNETEVNTAWALFNDADFLNRFEVLIINVHETSISDLMSYILLILKTLDAHLKILILALVNESLFPPHRVENFQESIQVLRAWQGTKDIRTLPNLQVCLQFWNDWFLKMYQDWAREFRVQFLKGCEGASTECKTRCFWQDEKCRDKPFLTVMMDIVKAFCGQDGIVGESTIRFVHKNFAEICEVLFGKTFTDTNCAEIIHMAKLIQMALMEKIRKPILWSQIDATKVPKEVWLNLFSANRDESIIWFSTQFEPNYEAVFLTLLDTIDYILKRVR